tara:strand:- start:63 stop:1025 length:963 start_codon:yes stop_codon:yes gene_type:complete
MLKFENYPKFSARVYRIDPLLTPNTEIVVLNNLDGSGYLRGSYIDVLNYCGSEPDGCIAGRRVNSSNNVFVYEPIEYGYPNYFGISDTTDEGHQFDETMAYYAGDTIAQYFFDNFDFELEIISILLYTPGDLYCRGIGMGCTDADGNIYIPPPNRGPVNNMRDVKGIMHEYVHNAYHDYRNNPPTILDEGYAIYFASSVVDDSKYSLYMNIENPKNIDNNYQINDSDHYLRPFAFAAALWDARNKLDGTIGKIEFDKLVFESWKLQSMDRDPGVDGMVSLIEASKRKYGVASSTHRHNRGIIIEEFSSHGIVCDTCSPAS